MASAFSGPLAFHVSVATLSLCSLGTTHALTLLLSRDFCWASRTQLTSVLDDGFYLGSHGPITALAPGPEETEGVCTHGGGTTPDLLPVESPPHLTLT